jgi:tripartite-type tricarboxylate transporter receptor subunit TctC
MLIKTARFLKTAVVFAIGLLALAITDAWPQSARIIKIVVPLSPGGAVDFTARLLADEIQRTQGVTIAVETRPGAGSIVGTEMVARSAPDGNTLLINATGNLLIPPQLRKLNYDPLSSFVPICELVTIADVITVNSASPYRTLGDLIGAARAKPGDVTIGSLGPATDLQIVFEKIKRATGVNLTFVPYPGVAPAVDALLGQYVTAVISSYSSVSEQIKAGELRPLATPTKTRIEALPDVPTVAQAGYNVDSDVWFGLFAPAATPKETTSRLADWFAAAVKSPDLRSRFVDVGLYPAGTCGAEFAAMVRAEYADFGGVIRDANIKAE